MSWRLVAIVWIIAGVGAGVCWRLSERTERSAADVAATSGPRPLLVETDLPIERVERIRIERRDAPALVLDRAGDGWMQVDPFPYPVDPFSARQVVAAALQLEVGRVIEGDALDTLAALALAPPEATVVYEWDEGSRRIELGRLGVAGRAFVRVDGADRVDVVGQQLHQRVLGMDPKEWRLRRLLPETSVEATSVLIELGDARTALERSGRRWRMTEPVSTRVDDAALETFLRTVATAQSGGFLADEPETLGPYGLDAPVATLTVVMPDGAGGDRSARLLVGAPIGVGGGDRFGMVEGRPTIVRLPNATLAALFPTAAALVDPTACGVRPADVKRIRVKGPDADFELERDLDVWRLVGGDEREVPTSAANDLLQRLTAARAGRIALQPFPRELGQGFMTLYGFDLRPITTVQIAHDPTSDTWALENGDGVLRLFPSGFKPPLSLEDLGLE